MDPPNELEDEPEPSEAWTVELVTWNVFFFSRNVGAMVCVFLCSSCIYFCFFLFCFFFFSPPFLFAFFVCFVVVLCRIFPVVFVLMTSVSTHAPGLSKECG